MSVGSIVSGLTRPATWVLRYAWVAKVAVKIAWKFYKYRKDGYSKEELTDILGTFLNEIGIKIDKSRIDKQAESINLNINPVDPGFIDKLPKPKLTVRDIIESKNKNKI